MLNHVQIVIESSVPVREPGRSDFGKPSHAEGGPPIPAPDYRRLNRGRRSHALTLLGLVAGFACLTARVDAAISVGPLPTGTGTNTFDATPAPTEWATFTNNPPGGAGDFTTAVALDADVIANMNAASITMGLPTSSTLPLSANVFARRNSNAAGNWLQTAPTSVKYSVLMATLSNDSGGSLAALNVSYDLGNNLAAGTTAVEEIPGHRVFYSQTGSPGSWRLAAGLSGGTLGRVNDTLSLGAWASGALLYVLWVDDNAAANRDNTGDEEGGYTIDNWVAVGIKKDVAFQQGVDGYTGAVDTLLHGGGTADTEYSTAIEITCDGSDSGEAHNLIRFNNLFGSGPGQVPLGKTIQKVTLTLNVTDPGDLINLHRLNKDWAATNTWNEFDPVNLDGVLSGFYTARTADDTEAAFTPDASFTANGTVPYFFDIDIAVATVQAWADGTATNYGWALVPTAGGGMDWTTSDNATNSLRPKLTITWGEAGAAVVEGITATPAGFKIQVTDGAGPKAVNTNTIVVKLDGVNVTAACAITQAGTAITVTYAAPALFASGSAHTANITFSDVDAPPKQQSTDLPFTVVTYATIPAGYALTAADIATNEPGFRWRVHQNALLTADNNQRPLDQLDGKLIDPGTGLPYVNEADPNFQGVALAPASPADPAWAPLKFDITNVINMSQVAGENNRYFPNDEAMPGIPSDLSGIAGELITYLELPVGVHTMGVSSDDGSRTTAVNPYVLPQGVMLGEHVSSGETIFTFAVSQAGIYAMRTVWEESGGGAHIEWFTVKADGTKVLVNDTANGGVRAYRETLSPYVQSLNPLPGATGVPLSTTIDITLADGSVSKVRTSSVKLWLNGSSVTPAVNKPAGTNITTVTFDPPGNLAPETPYTVRLEFADDATPSRTNTAEYTFTTAYTSTLLFAIDDTMQWRYSNDGSDQGTAWRAKDFVDSAWPEGPALLALEGSATVEPIRTPLLRDANGDGTLDIVTDYFRGRFTLASLPYGGRLLLRCVLDDGAVFYINGQEVYRFGIGAVPVTYSTLAADHEGRDHYDGPILIVATNLVVGQNVMAVEVHQTSATSSDVVFGAELSVVTSTPPLPPQFTIVRLEAGGLRLEWTGTGTLQQATVVTGPYTNAPNQSNPQVVPTTGAAGFYRIKQ